MCLEQAILKGSTWFWCVKHVRHYTYSICIATWFTIGRLWRLKNMYGIVTNVCQRVGKTETKWKKVLLSSETKLKFLVHQLNSVLCVFKICIIIINTQLEPGITVMSHIQWRSCFQEQFGDFGMVDKIAGHLMHIAMQSFCSPLPQVHSGPSTPASDTLLIVMYCVFGICSSSILTNQYTDGQSYKLTLSNTISA